MAIAAANTKKCPFCGGTDLIDDSVRGDVLCGNPDCGELVEEGTMTNEVKFMSGSNGAAQMSGTRMMWSDSVGGGQGGVITSNQEAAVSRGLTKIGWIADRLNLGVKLQESGRRMYQLAVQMSFNVGRPTRFVACACLYIVCRRNRSPHLLIDFADVLQTPVKVLGRTYMKLLRRLVGRLPDKAGDTKDMGEHIPMIDPSLFIERFSVKMNLGQMQNRVKKTAMVLIQFMQRDWICVGRRPNGLCGAALLVAAYYHGLRCTAKEVADVVRMSEATIRLRLWEMHHTPIAQMTRSDLESAGADVEYEKSTCAPPCMQRRMRKEKQMALLDGPPALLDGAPVLAVQDQQKTGASIVTAEMLSHQLVAASSTAACDAVIAGSAAVGVVPSRNAVISSGSSAMALEDDVTTHLVGASPAPSSEGRDAHSSGSSPDVLAMERKARYDSQEPTDIDVEEMAKDITRALMIGASPTQSNDGRLALSSSSSPRATPVALDSPQPLSNHSSPLPLQAAALISKLSQDKFKGESGESVHSDPDDILDALEDAQTGAKPVDSEGEGEEEALSDAEDDDLAMYCLDLEEQQDKSDIWHEVNKDYLEEWHVRGQEIQRRKKRQSAEQSGGAAGSKGGKDGSKDGASSDGAGSRKTQRTSSSYPVATSTSHAVAMALARKGNVKASKINLDALESLFA